MAALSPPAGVALRLSLLKSSAIIVLRNLHHVLYLAALCFLLFYFLVMASTSLRSLLSDLSLFVSFTSFAFLTYNLTLPATNWSLAGLPTPIKTVDSAAVHELYDPPAASGGTARQVFTTRAFMIFSIMSVILVTQAYLEAAKMVDLCRNFGIVVLLEALGWAMYAAQGLARTTSDADGESMLMLHDPPLQKGAGEYRSSRSAAIACSMRSIGHCTVKASMWASGVAYAVSFIWWWWHTQMGGGEGEADHHGFSAQALFITGSLVVGVSVMGLPAVLCAGMLSTKACLDMSIRQFCSDGHAHNSPSYHTFDT